MPVLLALCFVSMYARLRFVLAIIPTRWLCESIPFNTASCFVWVIVARFWWLVSFTDMQRHGWSIIGNLGYAGSHSDLRVAIYLLNSRVRLRASHGLVRLIEEFSRTMVKTVLWMPVEVPECGQTRYITLDGYMFISSYSGYFTPLVKFLLFPFCLFSMRFVDRSHASKGVDVLFSK